MHASRSQRHLLPSPFRRGLLWLGSAFCLIAAVIGVLSVHSADVEHARSSVVSVAVAQTPTSGMAAASSAAAPVVTQQCDGDCLDGLLECVLAMATCVALLLLARATALLRRLIRRWVGFRVLDLRLVYTADVGVLASRPDLHLLSISRT